MSTLAAWLRRVPNTPQDLRAVKRLVLFPLVNGQAVTELVEDAPQPPCSVWREGHEVMRLKDERMLWRTWTVEDSRLQTKFELEVPLDGNGPCTGVVNLFAFGHVKVDDQYVTEELEHLIASWADAKWDVVETRDVVVDDNCDHTARDARVYVQALRAFDWDSYDTSVCDQDAAPRTHLTTRHAREALRGAVDAFRAMAPKTQCELRKLLSISLSGRGPEDAKQEVRDIGRAIYACQKTAGMMRAWDVFNTIVACVSPEAFAHGSEVEIIWDGIGDWQC
jgi:hypothetical protein